MIWWMDRIISNSKRRRRRRRRGRRITKRRKGKDKLRSKVMISQLLRPHLAMMMMVVVKQGGYTPLDLNPRKEKTNRGVKALWNERLRPTRPSPSLLAIFRYNPTERVSTTTTTWFESSALAAVPWPTSLGVYKEKKKREVLAKGSPVPRRRRWRI